jgi:RNA polymerase sigma-70 factor, ECF subfamily
MDENRTYSDAELVELAKKDPDSFGILMERYQEPLFHYIRRIGQFSKEDTEDLLQEIFIKIYQKLNEYNEQLKFSSWAYRIAHNHVIDFFRKLGARPKMNMLEDSEWEKLIYSSVNLAKKISDKDCAEKAKLCLENLPDHYREVLILRFIEEKDYEEIMDILKKPKGSVATLIKRGRELLARKMKEQNIDCL